MHLQRRKLYCFWSLLCYNANNKIQYIIPTYMKREEGINDTFSHINIYYLAPIQYQWRRKAIMETYEGLFTLAGKKKYKDNHRIQFSTYYKYFIWLNYIFFYTELNER